MTNKMVIDQLEVNGNPPKGKQKPPNAFMRNEVGIGKTQYPQHKRSGGILTTFRMGDVANQFGERK